MAATVAPLAGAAAFLVWSAVALDDWSAPADRQRELRGGVAEPVSRLVRAGWRGIEGDEGPGNPCTVVRSVSGSNVTHSTGSALASWLMN